MDRRRTAGFAVTAAVVLAGCAELGPLEVPPEDARTRDAISRSPDQADRFATSDDEWAWIARTQVPGFAGVYYDEDGATVILLTDLAQGAAAQ
jgi:predicted small lipoprotein YifL